MAREFWTFAGYPAPWVYADSKGKKKEQQLLWGDAVLATDRVENGFRYLNRARNSEGWIRETDLQSDRLLDINFVDVGQGDGCFISTPDDDWILVDAGQGQEMFWYVRWRFNLKARSASAPPLHIEHAIITHPDKDHYAGLSYLLDSPMLTVGTLHHNGIVERKGDFRLGQESADGKYLVDLVQTNAAAKKLLADDDNVGSMPYPMLLRKALASKRVDKISMLSSKQGTLKGLKSDKVTFEVLGPVPEKADGVAALRKLGDDGKTKNGHSVVLKLIYDDVKIALGGDLNTKAQHYLLEHHSGIDMKSLAKASDADRDAALDDARAVFEVDVAKSCHHGSSDIEDFFLAATNASATVISSGDNEPHAHPRADALGAVGKFGRGNRPLIFSTELGRSHARLEKPDKVARQNVEEIEAARLEVNATGHTDAEDAHNVVADYQRSIAVWGTITLRTDGKSVLIAQKLEQKRQAAEFQYYCLEPTDAGLVFNPDA